MMRTWFLYDPKTGIFDGRRFSSSDPAAIESNRHGMGAIEGIVDPESQRVDVLTGALIDYKPPAPDADHDWIENDSNGRRVRRWVLSADVAERRRRVSSILGELRTLDDRLIRALGELAGDDESGDQRNEARAILGEIRQAKESLRAELRALQG